MEYTWGHVIVDLIVECRLPEVSALFGFDPQRFRPFSGSALEVSAPIYENAIFCQFFLYED